MKWPRYDPARDIYLCESCWNAGDWKHHCARGFCECCRCNRVHKPKVMLAKNEGQLEIPLTDGFTITARS